VYIKEQATFPNLPLQKQPVPFSTLFAEVGVKAPHSTDSVPSITLASSFIRFCQMWSFDPSAFFWFWGNSGYFSICLTGLRLTGQFLGPVVPIVGNSLYH